MKVIKEHWPRAFTKNAKEFKELFGVKKEIFQKWGIDFVPPDYVVCVKTCINLH